MNPVNLPVKKDIETIRKDVLTNIVKMLTNRKWILPENSKKMIEKLISSENDDQIYKINLDVKLTNVETYYPSRDGKERKMPKEFEDNVVMVKLLPQKVTSVSKSPIILEFFNTYKKCHKLLIVEAISEKTKQQLMSTKHMEVFKEDSLLMDLFEHVSSSKHEVLTPTEKAKYLESYHLTENQMQKQSDIDPVSLYLFLKVGQVVRIIRDSEITASAIGYRIVGHKA